MVVNKGCLTGSRQISMFVVWCRVATLLFVLSSIWTVSIQAQAFTPATLPTGVDQTQMNSANVLGPTRAGGDYVIGPDDVLNVYILDVPELSRDYRVSNDGMVTIPVLAKPLMAAGLTLERFSDNLSRQLKAQGLVSDPHVTISVVQSRLHSVSITGAVRRPQIYPVLTQTTLLDVLSQAEGLSDDAGNIAIVRRGDIGIQALQEGKAANNPNQVQVPDTFSVDLKRLLGSGDPKLNPTIYPGDRITIPRAGIVYVIGAVNKPGGFTMNGDSQGMTVLQAIALAEDTKSTAKRNSTVILRRDPQSPEGRDRIPVDLKAVLEGKKADPKLQAEDILFVPDSAGKRALNRGIESVVQAATGVVIFDSHF
jgi:polysaccharide biosynthesis/export protein